MKGRRSTRLHELSEEWVNASNAAEERPWDTLWKNGPFDAGNSAEAWMLQIPVDSAFRPQLQLWNQPASSGTKSRATRSVSIGERADRALIGFPEIIAVSESISGSISFA